MEEAVSGNYISLILPGGEELNNLEQKSGYPKVEDGYGYDFNGTDVMSTMVTWYVDDEYAKLDQVSFSFSLLNKESTQAPPIIVKVGDLPSLGSGSSEDDSMGLPIPGFEILASILTIFIVSLKRREL